MIDHPIISGLGAHDPDHGRGRRRKCEIGLATRGRAIFFGSNPIVCSQYFASPSSAAAPQAIKFAIFRPGFDTSCLPVPTFPVYGRSQ